jgi:hypothetical protein
VDERPKNVTRRATANASKKRFINGCVHSKELDDTTKGHEPKNPKPAAPLQSIAELDEGGGEFGDGFQEEVGFGGTEAFFCGERAEDGDGGAYAGATSHLQVFGGVAYIDGFFGMQAHAA